MKRQIDAEIQKKNYEKELLLCKKAGGDIERYRRLSFNALQLEQIRKGLESKVDVELFMDPAKSWLEMELIRTSLEAGIDIELAAVSGNCKRCGGKTGCKKIFECAFSGTTDERNPQGIRAGHCGR